MPDRRDAAAERRLVWDLPLRMFHWLLALSLVASWVSGRAGYDFRALHMWLGYWMLGLLVFRAAWGFVGPRHARFASFFPRPRRLLPYLRDTLRGTSRESVGHNPLGSLMVFAMLICVALQSVSGLFLFDDIFYSGPFHEAVSGRTADELNGLHHSRADLLVVLVLVHVSAVLFYTLRKRQRLVRAMLTGKKDASVVPEEEAIASSRIVLAIVVAALAAAFVYWLVVLAPAL